MRASPTIPIVPRGRWQAAPAAVPQPRATGHHKTHMPTSTNGSNRQPTPAPASLRLAVMMTQLIWLPTPHPLYMHQSFRERAPPPPRTLCPTPPFATPAAGNRRRFSSTCGASLVRQPLPRHTPAPGPPTPAPNPRLAPAHCGQTRSTERVWVCRIPSLPLLLRLLLPTSPSTASLRPPGAPARSC